MCCALRPRNVSRSAASSSGEQHVAAEVDALAHLAGQALRHQRRRLVVHDVEDRGAVGPRLLRHLVDAAKAFGDQEAGLDALAFQQRVGADRGAVTEKADIAGGARRRAISASTPCRMARDGSSGVEATLADRNRAGLLVEIDEIRERPTRIDRNPVARHSSASLKRNCTLRQNEMPRFRGA